jgi:hypothetical protein
MAKVTRAATSRTLSARPAIGGAVDTRGRLHIDPSHIPPGMEVQWVRESVYGEYDEGNLEANLEQRGFQPATTDDFPGLAPPEFIRKRRDDNLIRRGGLVLMFRPTEVGVAERAERKRADEATIRAVNKELEKGMDGKNFQASPDSGVQVALDRGVVPGAGGAFADA